MYWSATPEIYPYTAASYLGFTELGGNLAYEVTGLENDQEHAFIVTARCGGSERAPSAEVVATPSAGPALVAGRYRLHDMAEGTVVDVVTGLQWTRCALGQDWAQDSCRGESAGYTHSNAQDAAAQLNAAGGYGGFTDSWVPVLAELQGLVYCSSGQRAHFKGDDPGVCAFWLMHFPPAHPRAIIPRMPCKKDRFGIPWRNLISISLSANCYGHTLLSHEYEY